MQQMSAPLRYATVHDGRAIECLVCGLVSHNPHDVAHRYCGHCNRFHDDATPGAVNT